MIKLENDEKFIAYKSLLILSIEYDPLEKLSDPKKRLPLSKIYWASLDLLESSSFLKNKF